MIVILEFVFIAASAVSMLSPVDGTQASKNTMARILRIDSSSRLQDSHSRELADFFQATWLKQHPHDEVVRRDLVATPIPHIAEATIAGYYTPPEQQTDAMKAATALSDELIAELMTADILLFSVPMYNFSIPSSLKAYIDQIVRVGHTFGFDPEKGFYSHLAVLKSCLILRQGYD